MSLIKDVVCTKDFSIQNNGGFDDTSTYGMAFMDKVVPRHFLVEG